MNGLKIKFSIVGLLLTVFMVMSIDISGQVQNDLKNILTNKQWQRYQKGEMLIEKGRSLIAEADSDNIDRSDTKQFRREKDMKKQQANVLIKDGYNIKMKTLEDHIKEAGVEKKQNKKVIARLEELKSVLESGMKKSKKIYGRSDKTPDLSKSVKYQDDALKEKEVTVAAIEKGLLEINEMPDETLTEKVAENEESPVVEKKVLTEPEPETVIAEEVVKAQAPVVEVVAVEETIKQSVVEAKEPEPVVEQANTHDVYFTIQIMADKVKVSQSRLDRVYSGSRKILENAADGWYRYSVGKFGSYSEAASAMKKEEIKGYVVAYKGSTRISVSEAKRLLGGV